MTLWLTIWVTKFHMFMNFNTIPRLRVFCLFSCFRTQKKVNALLDFKSGVTEWLLRTTQHIDWITPSIKINIGTSSRTTNCQKISIFFCWGKHIKWNRLPWLGTITISVSYFMTGGPGEEHVTNKPPPTGRTGEMSKEDSMSYHLPEFLLASTLTEPCVCHQGMITQRKPGN